MPKKISKDANDDNDERTVESRDADSASNCDILSLRSNKRSIADQELLDSKELSSSCHTDASQIDSSLAGKVDFQDEDNLEEIVVEKPPKIVRHRRAFFNIGGKSHLWPDGLYTYVFDHRMHSEPKSLLLKAFKEIGDRVPCVKFVPADKNSEQYIIHTSHNIAQCSSDTLGFMPGIQAMVNIGEYCNYGLAMHEVFHVLGAIHTQNRPDRDNFVEINWDNINKAAAHSFYRKVGDVSPSDGEYDYKSAMHYPAYAFNLKEGVPSLRALNSTVKLKDYGHYVLDEQDYESLKRWYGCSTQTLTESSTEGSAEGSADKSTDNSTDGSTDNSTDNSTDSSTDNSTDGSTDNSTDNSTEGSTNNLTEGSTDNLTDSDNSADSSSDSSSDKSIDNSTGDNSTDSSSNDTKRKTRKMRRWNPDCIVGPWSGWSDCKNRYKIKSRYIEMPPNSGGLSCPNEHKKIRCRPKRWRKRSAEPETIVVEVTDFIDEENGKVVSHLKKKVRVVEGRPIELVVANPKNFPTKWYRVIDGNDFLLSPTENQIYRTAAGNNRLTIDNSSVEDNDGQLFVTKIFMKYTILRVAWIIEVLSEDEYFSNSA